MVDVTREIAKRFPDCIIAQRSGNRTLFIRNTFNDVYTAYERIGKNVFHLYRITEEDLNNLLWSQHKNLFEFLEILS